MSDERECYANAPNLPQITEEGSNPGWKIRVGVSRRFVETLAEANERGIWFDTEEKKDAYVQSCLDNRTRDDERFRSKG